MASIAETHSRKHKCLLVCNYILLAAASSFIFLTLSLRLLPSLCGFFLILLHVLTILIAVFACTVATSGSGKWFATHMVTTVLTAIFEEFISVLIFASTSDFLGYLKPYVKEEDGIVILRLAGSLSVLIFFLEWIVLALTFLLRYLLEYTKLKKKLRRKLKKKLNNELAGEEAEQAEEEAEQAEKKLSKLSKLKKKLSKRRRN